MDLEMLRRTIQRHPKSIIRVLYQGSGDLMHRARYLRPYELREERRFTYLFATELSGNAHSIKKFRVDRMKSAEATQLTYEPVWEVQI